MNGRFQLYPLPRIGLALILGIVFGDCLHDFIPTIVWLLLVVVGLTMMLLKRKQPYTISTVLFLSVFFFGSWLVSAYENHTKFFDSQSEIEYQGVVVNKPVQRGKTLRFDLLVVDKGEPFKMKTSLWYDSLSNKINAIQLGSGLVVRSHIKPIVQFDSLSHFDYVRWAQVNGFRGQTWIAHEKWQHFSVPLSPLSILQKTRLVAMKWREKLVNSFPSEAKNDSSQMAIIAAMTLGDKSALGETTKELFSITGSSHVLALSGLHLGILYAFLLLVFPRRKMRVLSQMLIILSLSQMLIILSIWAYVLLTGMSTSLIRSATMCTILSVISLANRSVFSLNSLAFAAIILLVVNPLSLWDIGFQLSFASVLAILLVFRWLQNWGFVPHTLAQKAFSMFFILPVAAQIGTFPLVLYHFGRFSCYFLLSNLVVIPIAMVVLYGVLLAFVCSPIHWLYLAIFRWLSQLVEWLQTALSFIASLPYASVSGIRLSVFQVLLVYLLIISLFCLIHQLLKAHVRARRMNAFGSDFANTMFTGAKHHVYEV